MRGWAVRWRGSLRFREHGCTPRRGAGPLLLLVVGGKGDPGVFFGVADRLAGDFTVVTYARRGFARSPVRQPGR